MKDVFFMLKDGFVEIAKDWPIFFWSFIHALLVFGIFAAMLELF